MSGPDSVRAGLASADVATVLASARSAVSMLRNASVSDPMSLGQRLLPLVDHPEPKVRQAVAEACEYLPDPIGEMALVRLREDGDIFVKRAALRASRERARVEPTRSQSEELYHVNGEILAKLESTYDQGARKLGELAARKREEFAVSQLYHELTKIRTPLRHAVTSIRAEALKPNPDGQRIAEDVRHLRERLEFHFAILESAKSYTSSYAPQFRDENLAAVIDEARDHLVERLGERASKLRFANDVPRSLVAEIDRYALLQAIQNVVQNGAEAYAPECEHIEITVSANTSKGDSLVSLSFADHGAGISEEQLAHLYIPYRSRKPGGTGVGLLKVRKMVEEVHGGVLDVASVEGEGTTVTMTFPFQQPRPGQRRSRGAKKPAKARKAREKA